MIKLLGPTQQKLLTLLNQEPDGMLVDELAGALTLSRNAVRQHLSTLEKIELVEAGPTLKTRGRPGLSYRLSQQGQELFPRLYSWFAEMLLQFLLDDKGGQGLISILEQFAETVARPYLENLSKYAAPDRRQQIASLMTQLGYEARVEGEEIIASNCVYHSLASRFPEVCQFDIALLSHLSGATVEQRECMVREGKVCRFGFSLPVKDFGVENSEDSQHLHLG